jgi:GNAT superfamily N-acetyltransferase
VLLPPQPITEEHDLAGFSCGKPALDKWLRERAVSNHLFGDAKTLVVVDADAGPNRVVAFYALAPGSVIHSQVVAKLRRNAANPIPMILLARMAVDSAYVGKGIGKSLLFHAMTRAELAAREIGGRGIMVDAIDEDAARFYLRWKFKPMPGNPLLLIKSMDIVRASLAAATQAAA